MRSIASYRNPFGSMGAGPLPDTTAVSVATAMATAMAASTAAHTARDMACAYGHGPRGQGQSQSRGRTLDPGPHIRDPGSWLQDPAGISIPDFGSRILAAGSAKVTLNLVLEKEQFENIRSIVEALQPDAQLDVEQFSAALTKTHHALHGAMAKTASTLAPEASVERMLRRATRSCRTASGRPESANVFFSVTVVSRSFALASSR